MKAISKSTYRLQRLKRLLCHHHCTLNLGLKVFTFSIALVIAFSSISAQVLNEIEPKEKYYQVKINLAQYGVLAKLQMLGILDHVSRVGNELVTVFSESDLDELKKAQIHYEIVINNLEQYYRERAVQELQLLTEKGSQKFIEETFPEKTANSQSEVPKKFRLGNVGGFLSVNDVAAELDSMASIYPNLISRRRTLGNSVEGRPIWYVELGSETSQGKPQVLYTAMHHAREPGGMMALIYFMWWLLENYNTDAEAKALLDSRRITVVPIVNPDGYTFNIQNSPGGGGLWRKNRKRNANNTFGVDLNRNYGTVDFWNSAFGGSSTSPSSDTYRGTDPFSEPETAALRDFIAINQFKAVLNYHTYSNLLIYPYGYARRETPDAPIFREYARRMTESNGYTYGLDIETVGYNTRGTSDDWMYGDSLTKPKMIAMTPEVGTISDGFWPVPSRISSQCQENLFPNLFLAWVSGAYLTATSEYAFVPKNTEVSLPYELKNIGLETGKKVKVTFNSQNGGIQFFNQTEVFDSIGSWQSINSNAIKIKISPNLPDGPLSLTMEITQDGGFITSQQYAIAAFTPLSIREDKTILEYKLEQNYPNPFNPTTVIRFQIPSQMQVRLEISDVMGRKIAVLQNGALKGGLHAFSFDGAKYGLTSGVYFYRLVTSEFQQSKKMILLK